MGADPERFKNIAGEKMPHQGVGRELDAAVHIAADLFATSSPKTCLPQLAPPSKGMQAAAGERAQFDDFQPIGAAGARPVQAAPRKARAPRS
ncbi:hypothetical protein [Salipiger sp. PrR007]|nr:hypothetical protein [Salipiger sp. PrR007]NDW34652.1 hypothetical protein [Salipiger sp. PrR007]